MTTKAMVFVGLAAAMFIAAPADARQAVSPENAVVPEMSKQATRTGKRVNRVIDMWLKGQPVYYTQTSGGGYEQGKALAATKADYITYEMEHGPLDFKELREFMRGLVEAGLNACNENNVIAQLKEGVMICTGGDTPAAEKDRAFTKRLEPW